MTDGGRVIDMLDFEIIKDLKFPTCIFEHNAQGKLMLAMMFGMSKYYSDNLGEGIRRAQNRKVKSGVWPMVAPIGYRNENKIIVPDPERAPLVRKIFELYATGEYCLDRLMEIVNGLGLTNGSGTKFKGRPLSRTQYSRLLRNSIYYGTFWYRDEQYEGSHEPLITKALFDQCKEIMKRKSQPKVLDRFKPYVFRGLFRCGECGCFITTETQKGHNYLRCTKRVKRDCSQPYTREELITDQITDLLHSVAIPDDWADWMIEQVEADKKNDAATSVQVEQAISDDIRAVEAKLDRLMIGYVDGLFNSEEYKAKKSQLLAEKQAFVEKRAVVRKNHETRFEPIIRFVLALKQAKIVASQGTDEEKCDFLKTVGSNPIITEKSLRFVPRNAWKTVVDSGRFAQHTTAPLISGAVTVGETHQNHNEAERGRFELPLPFRAGRFSKPVHSTTLPPLQVKPRRVLGSPGGPVKSA
jgi:site-specific DNA recombinase